MKLRGLVATALLATAAPGAAPGESLSASAPGQPIIATDWDVGDRSNFDIRFTGVTAIVTARFDRLDWSFSTFNPLAIDLYELDESDVVGADIDLAASLLEEDLDSDPMVSAGFVYRW